MNKCYLCKSAKTDDIKYGELMTNFGMSVHYYCLLLTSNLLQKGNDKEGFYGFMPADIKAEAKRVSPLICIFCKKKSANLACCANKCRRTFHLTCGLENECESEFIGTFKSFCNRHIGRKKCLPKPSEICCVCYDELVPFNKKFKATDALRAACCRKAWFHKWCIAAYAKTSGYFFKCPLCNDSDTFRDRLVRCGIFIPDRDAAWELEPNAFGDLLERPSNCSAENCVCKKGRKYDSTKNPLTPCRGCGAVSFHKNCRSYSSNSRKILCETCQQILEKNNPCQNKDMEEEEEEIDVCNIIDDDIDESVALRSNNNVVETQNPLEEDANGSIRMETDASSDKIGYLNSCNRSYATISFLETNIEKNLPQAETANASSSDRLSNSELNMFKDAFLKEGPVKPESESYLEFPQLIDQTQNINSRLLDKSNEKVNFGYHCNPQNLINPFNDKMKTKYDVNNLKYYKKNSPKAFPRTQGFFQHNLSISRSENCNADKMYSLPKSNPSSYLQSSSSISRTQEPKTCSETPSVSYTNLEITRLENFQNTTKGPVDSPPPPFCKKTSTQRVIHLDIEPYISSKYLQMKQQDNRNASTTSNTTAMNQYFKLNGTHTHLIDELNPNMFLLHRFIE